MRQKVAYRLLNGGALAVLALGAVLGTGAVKAQDITINMAVPDWPPTRFMKEEFDRSFKSPSGKNVTLAMDFIPWPSFYERVAASLTSGEQKYQMIVTDSQWLGSFVEGGYYKDLTEDMKKDPELTAIMKDLHPVLVSAYSTYPHQTAKQLEEAGEWPQGGRPLFRVPAVPGHLRHLLPQGPVLQRAGSRQIPGELQPEAALHLRGLAAGRLGRLGEHRQALPAQEGRSAGRRHCRRRFLWHRVPGRRRLRLLDHGGERLHLAERRLDLGRDHRPRRARRWAS